ncbi:hypothetical protein LEN26_019533 [Aphanomyces euteiches]|nr:hypothetical protein LEN26_019533 [Aphanomyces euteiches]KAH9126972.1 hypothetical protein AeMF1_002648 [Aphanomyces euteiches]KAH9192412.1 hypothetical protein AeNC1_005623 [Aphanomyces euteiches]
MTTAEGRSWKSIRFQELTVGDKIGGGGVGIVYRGKYLSKPVALKTLFDPRVDDALKQEFMDELHVMSKLNHPNVVAFIGACLEAPNLCFVMELCTMSMYELLHTTNDPISVASLVTMATQVVSAMRYLHGLSPAIVHRYAFPSPSSADLLGRDLKSQNVLVDTRGDVKLCDFGLVCTKERTAGTPAYMPPELLAGKPFSKAVDVYMFGVLLWEMFARDVPFRGYDIDDIQRKVLHGDRPRIPTTDCPPPCQELIRQCWHSEPSSRPTFDAIYDKLKHVDASKTVQAVDSIVEEDALDSLLMGKKR